MQVAANIIKNDFSLPLKNVQLRADYVLNMSS